MREKGKTSERERRDWIIILIILLIGFLCVIVAGEQAARFSPRWRLDTNMRSNLDPDSDFLTNRPDNLYEPVDPSILTQQIRINNFLTPGALFEINTLPPLLGATNTPIKTVTPVPTLISSPTSTAFNPTTTPIKPSPTNTLIYYPPPPSTNTPKPPPTNTPITPLPTADLAITKNDGGLSAVDPNDTITYTVRVTNNGPSDVTGAILSDPSATGLSKTAVVCSSDPGQCTTAPTIADLEGGSFALPTLNNGEFYEISITTNVTATSGSVTNTATVTAPAGFTDPTGNNSASDTNNVNPTVDLSITKTNGDTDYVANAWKIYTIEIFNPSTFDITGATVTDIFSTNPNIDYSTVIWGCLDCVPILGGIGDINNQSVNIPSNSSITFNVALQAVSSPFGSLDNTATVTAPSGVTDPNTGNNSDTDTDTLIISSGTTYGNIGTGPDGGIENLGQGDSVVMTLSSTVSKGHSGIDIIYYEQLIDLGGTLGPGIAMDWIILDIGDGSNWYNILDWGTPNSGNVGTNIDTPLAVPPNPTDCSDEADNCSILDDLLYNGNSSGITIDIDLMSWIPSGDYNYIRITVPSGGTDGGVGIDGIYVVP